jgi:hypothetical protein
MFGYDESQQTGLMSKRLANDLAVRLDPPDIAPRNRGLVSFQQIERQLRCGRIDAAMRALAARGLLQFGADISRPRLVSDFLVCDDERDVAHFARSPSSVTASFLDHGPHVLTEGQWVAITRTDYSTTPPNLRAGRLALIDHILPEGRRVLLRHVDDTLQEVDLTRFPHLRPANAITLREARHAPPLARLRIHVTRTRNAWACALLAATREGHAVLKIDPSIARNVTELIDVVRRSLPSALPTELFERADPNADVVQAVNAAMLGPQSTVSETTEWDIELFPEPETTELRLPALLQDNAKIASNQPVKPASPQEIHAVPQAFSRNKDVGKIRTTIPRWRLHEKLWTVLASENSGQAVLNQLERACQSPDRDLILNDLLAFCCTGGPTAALVLAAFGIAGQTSLANDSALGEMVEVDEHVLRLPRDWGLWDIYVFRREIELLAINRKIWRLGLGPAEEPSQGPAGLGPR